MRQLLTILCLLLLVPIKAQRLVKDITPDSTGTYMSYLGNTKNGFILSIYTNEQGQEPWVSDGTDSGTKLLQDIVPGVTGSLTTDYYYSNDSLLFFLAYEMGKYKLWRTDGSIKGTFKIFDFEVNPPSNFYDEGIFCNGKFYFNNPHGGKNSLWSSDGSIAGTKLVYDFNDSGLNTRMALNEWNGELMFFAGERNYGLELWRSDGTTAGTRMVKDIYPGAFSSVQLGRTKTASVGSKLFFAAKSNEMEGEELYVTDGTEAGTKLFIDFEPEPYYSSSPLIVQGIDSLFIFNTQGFRSKAWKSDGTVSNTKEIIESENDSFFVSWAFKTYPFKDQLALYIYTSEFASEPFICDKQFKNVKLLRDINPGLNNSNLTGEFFQKDNKLYLLAFNNMLGNDIWFSDGTTDNTLVYLELFKSNSGTEDLFEWKDHLYFTGNIDAKIGTELYELNINNTGIKETKSNAFGIYPNPVRAGKILAISEPVCTYRLHNTLGQLVLEGETTEGKCLIPEKLSAGMYTITIQNEQATQTSLIVIE